MRAHYLHARTSTASNPFNVLKLQLGLEGKGVVGEGGEGGQGGGKGGKGRGQSIIWAVAKMWFKRSTIE